MTLPETDELQVDLGERGYSIFIGEQLLSRSGELISRVALSRRAFIVSNETVAPWYRESLQKSLADQNMDSDVLILPDGEQYKNWDELYTILGWLLASHAERKTPLIALGGGVIGDIGGLAAALYQRGMPLVQIPTSLLAQVDSSVGGKTAVNHPLGKNMIGAFHQPKLVLIDTETLATLPKREYISGIAEIIKYGAICNIGFLDRLEENARRLLARESSILRYVIKESCRIKAEIVAADERESGMRALLNLGHTFGHAIETALGYGTWLHGEAISAGMVLAARLSEEVCGLKVEDTERMIHILDSFGLPVRAPEIDPGTWLTLMQRDKKTVGGKTSFILLKQLGQAFVCDDVSDEALLKVIKYAAR
ncbi:MAG: 3-dehydroquinate synthase [Burkholderiales bacterium]|jgi:3-dehydroquinate synthase|nr:3-dehydroquinate synthase [Burkholderiales bacterium]